MKSDIHIDLLDEETVSKFRNLITFYVNTVSGKSHPGRTDGLSVLPSGEMKIFFFFALPLKLYKKNMPTLLSIVNTISIDFSELVCSKQTKL